MVAVVYTHDPESACVLQHQVMGKGWMSMERDPYIHEVLNSERRDAFERSIACVCVSGQHMQEHM